MLKGLKRLRVLWRLKQKWEDIQITVFWGVVCSYVDWYLQP